MKTDRFHHDEGHARFSGFIALPAGADGPRPCVLVVHQWAGEGDHERAVARKLADIGYVGIAIDVLGEGVRGDPRGNNSALIAQLRSDRALLKRRLLAAVDAAAARPEVDANAIAAIGYCFGGLCVLDLARSADPRVKGVVSLHGTFEPAGFGPQPQITASVLILHGYDDPRATPQQLLDVATELTAAKADWQIHAYGHVLHAFALRHANQPEFGVAYDAVADQRSWQALTCFLAEVFST